MLIPQLQVRDIRKAVAFLTDILDFTLVHLMHEDAPFYAVLARGADELHLQLTPPARTHQRCSAIIVCDDVDALLAGFVARGLVLPDRPESPVHSAPVDQTWGTREIYIEDPNGNTLIYQQR